MCRAPAARGNVCREEGRPQALAQSSVFPVTKALMRQVAVSSSSGVTFCRSCSLDTESETHPGHCTEQI